MKIRQSILLFVIAAVLLAACGGGQSSASASDATYAYLEALANKDKDTVVSLTCKDWEEQAMLEVDALMSVGAQLNNVSCSQVGEEGADALVVCSGTLDLTYNDEVRAIELDKRTYTMTMEDGQWRVCSYK
jgi:ABC-type glycerol-3-phosphate transport system substrate-binding protein